VLRATGLGQYAEGRIDGVTLAERRLPGKPEPDSFLAGTDVELAGDDSVQQAVRFELLHVLQAGTPSEQPHADRRCAALAAPTLDLAVQRAQTSIWPTRPPPGGPFAARRPARAGRPARPAFHLKPTSR